MRKRFLYKTKLIYTVEIFSYKFYKYLFLIFYELIILICEKDNFFPIFFSFKIQSDKLLDNFTKSLSRSDIIVWSLLFHLFVRFNNYVQSVIYYIPIVFG